MGNSTTQEARELYLEYRKHGLGGWGPFIHYEDRDRDQKLSDAIDELLSRTSLLMINEKTIWLPSAWHAVLFFIRCERYTKYKYPPQHQLYRGHANPDWLISSTYDRLAGADCKSGVMGNLLFSYYLARRLYCPALNIRSYVALSRHFGFPSSYTDWTVDPAVAVYFATLPQPDAQEGRVFVLQVPDAMELSLEVLCPPPFCNRIHAQRGVFLRTSRSDNLFLRDRCISVQFPKPSDGEDFEVWRDGKHVELLTTHPWFERSVDWAKTKAIQYAESADDPEKVDALVSEAIKEIEPVPVEVRRESMVDQAAWAMEVLDMYHWLFIFKSKCGTKTTISEEVGEYVVSYNRAVTALAAEVVKFCSNMLPNNDYHNLDVALLKLLEMAGPPEGEDDDVLGVLSGN